MSEVVRSRHTDPGSSRWKRIAITAAGGTLLTLGLRRRTVPGYVAALAGGWLAYRGLRGGDREISLGNIEALEASARAVDVERQLTIQAPVDEVRGFLEDPGNIDRVLGETGSVQRLDEDRERWELNSPTGHTLSWEMRREDEDTGDELRWSTTGDQDVELSLSLQPGPDEDSTVVTLSIGFHPPGGELGEALFEQLEVVPHVLLGGMLRRMKSLIETGQAAPMPGASPRSGHPPAPEG